jgi:septum formation protein
LTPPLTLASRSPQRRAILEQLGVEFVVAEPRDVEELDEGEPQEVVVENALRKARSVAGERVLGVDTDVFLDDRVFGKPRSADDARAMLLTLSGRTHQVWSGIAIRERDGRERHSVACTKVRFAQLDERLLDWYLASGEWEGRAGGYAIQGRGAVLVEAIEGDFWNVVGLPVPELLELVPDLFRPPA